MIRFEPQAFDVGGFRSEEILLPESIARSVPKRQADFFYGRVAARRALRKLGHPPADIGIGTSREPLWPDGIVGSITHASPYAAAIAADAAAFSGIGIDLEQVVNLEERPALQSVVMRPAELALVEPLRTQLAHDIILTMVFSAKESFFKAAFYDVKRYFNFDAVTLSGFDLYNRVLTFDICERLSARLPAGTRFAVTFDVIDPTTVFTCCVLRA